MIHQPGRDFSQEPPILFTEVDRLQQAIAEVYPKHLPIEVSIDQDGLWTVIYCGPADRFQFPTRLPGLYRLLKAYH